MNPFIIDGYNLLYAFKDIPPGSLEAKREAILRFLNEERPQGRNPVVLVFDSREGGGQRQEHGDLAIVFAAGSADDWIASHVRTAPQRAATVVTNDQGLRRLVRGTGVKWMSADDFLKLRRSGREPAGPASGAGLDDITEDLKREWL